MGRLDGRVALITGAASGLGEATALRFAEEGARVVGFDLDASPRWDEVSEHASGTSFHVGDVTDERAVAAAIAALLDEHGGLDIVVNCAGVAGGGPVHLVPLEEFRRVTGVNLDGTFLVCKHALVPMLEQRSGSIVNIASVEGIEGTEGGSAYNASKGAVVLLTKNMAIDYGRRGIRVNCICPGFMDTPMFRSVVGNFPEAVRDRYRDQHKLGRFGRPDEIASAALFLASDDASFVTGHALVVDGGYTIGMRTELLDGLGLS
ncbi:MAG TPA: SDR family NAD(P)-dependent oxidoreductase [Acidimicrobiia bacterium]|nr:SDR family NAD(P)-dependent oxidoreductase [Acidimicrobiia bacterium]